MQMLHGPTMVIGRRRDVPMANRTLYLPDDVEHVAIFEGKFHISAGIDYFAIAGNQYPWDLVPDLVIGRPGYDNFMVETASLNNVSVVDASKTIVALHQTDEEGVGSGHRRKDSSYNGRIIARHKASYREHWNGCTRTDCTEYITKITNTTALSSNTLLMSESHTKRAIVVALRPHR